MLGIDAAHYEAGPHLPSFAEDGEEVDLSHAAPEIAAALAAKPLHQYAHDTIWGLYNSASKGIGGTEKFIAEYEARTGCTPTYLLVGYSQGAVVLGAQEQRLAERGQLGGVFFLGNPMHKFPQHSGFATGTDRRYSYCHGGDFVCDTSLASIGSALANSAGVHAEYFLEPRTGDVAAAEKFASWLNYPQK